MTDEEQFDRECGTEIAALGADRVLHQLTRDWFDRANALKYSYHFKAFGRPIIQYPQDIVAFEELIWAIRPTLIIETGIARGGSLVMSAAMLCLIDYAEAVGGTGMLDVTASRRRVIGIDIDIRAHNRAAIEAHPFKHKIELVEGSSVDAPTIAKIHGMVRPDDRVLVILDSNHTHDHVAKELTAYAPLVSKGSYCIVCDTVIEDLPRDSFGDRPWNVGDNPKTAARAYVEQLAASPQDAMDGTCLQFEIDRSIDAKLQISVAPEGYLRRLS